MVIGGRAKRSLITIIDLAATLEGKARSQFILDATEKAAVAVLKSRAPDLLAAQLKTA